MAMLSRRERIRLFVQLVATGYLAGVWWPTDWVAGLASLLIILFAIQDLVAIKKDYKNENMHR